MKMSTAGKIIIALIAGSLLICLAVGVIGVLFFRSTNSVVNRIMDPVAAVSVGSEIAEFEVPEGFDDPFSAHLAGYRMVAYTGTDGYSHIYFFQMPPGETIDVSNMESEFQRTFSTSDSFTDMQVVDTGPVTIAEQDVTLVTSEGTNHDGDPYREVTAVFQGKGGQALVVFSRPTASWDQAEVDAFLASIR